MPIVLGKGTRQGNDQSFYKQINAKGVGFSLLDIPLSQNDHLPQHVCSRCMTLFVSLEKSSIDLAAFKRAAMSGFEHAQMSLKRTKEMASQMGASPDTIRERPRSKVARRLPF